MSSKKAKWKNSVQKARRVSQSSSAHSTRKSSIIGEETTANELEEYLETLKKKSGIKSLWRGDSFDRVVRDEEDKTPDISISSTDDHELGENLPSEKADVDDDDDDFKVNLQMFSRSPSPTNAESSEGSVNPLKGLQMAEFALSEEELSDKILENNKLDDKLKSLTVSDKDVRSVVNDLSEPAEVLTEDEVEEEIEEDVAEESVVRNNKNSMNQHRSLSNDNKSPPRPVSDTKSHAGKHVKSPTKSQHSYTTDFSSASEIETRSERSHSKTYSDQKSSKSSRTSRSSRSSRSSQSSRSSRSSRSSQSSRSTKRSKSHDRSRSRRNDSDYSRSKNTDSGNKYRCDVGVQTAPPTEQFTIPPGLGVGMATSGPRLGMQYVDPSPIATHTVSPEAMEGENLPSEKADVDDDDDDFKVNLQMFSRSPSPTNAESSEGSVNPLKGLQMAEFALSEEELSDKILENNKLDDKLKSLTVSDKDVRSVVNDLSEPAEVLTEDEVEEEIEEDVAEESVVRNNKNSMNQHRSLSNDNKSPPRPVSDTKSHAGKHVKSPTKSQHSYTTDFSSASEIETRSERSHSKTYSDQKSSKSSRTSRSSRSSRSSQSSRSSRSSRSSQSSRSTKRSKSHDRSRSRRNDSDYSRSKNTDSGNKYRCDVGVQTAPPTEQFTIPPGLGVGMATSGPRLGMQYVDPSPIATHTVSPEAMEALTGYNPAIVALNNMLREQIRLVEQFVEINQRMYESYSAGVNSSYRYTTLEDTQQFIRRNRPKTISYEEALEQVR